MGARPFVAARSCFKLTFPYFPTSPSPPDRRRDVGRIVYVLYVCRELYLGAVWKLKTGEDGSAAVRGNLGATRAAAGKS